MARRKKANPYSPQHEATLDKLSDCSNTANDDKENVQQVEIKVVSNTNTNPLTYDGRQKLSQFIPECAQSSSNPAVRKKESQKAGAHHAFTNTNIISAGTTIILVSCMYILHGYAEKVLPH
jgi:hypothetical protein